MYFVYIIKSDKDNKLYYGLTKNLKKRLDQHNSGSVKSTKSRMPFKLVYHEEVKALLEARKREKYFKSGFGRKYVKMKLLALSSIG